MVLKIILLKTFLFFFVVNLSANLKLKHTDKYNTNFYSDNSSTSSKLFIGSNLFELISNEDFAICYNFIDSFLTTKNIQFNKKILLNNNNTLEIELINASQEDCNNLSYSWHEKYNIDWLKLLRNIIEINNFNGLSNSTKIILDELYTKEKIRPFNTSNIINSTFLAFVLPTYNVKENSKHKISKRYSLENTQINAIQILENNSIKNDELAFIFPACNKNTLLKNCISLNVLQNINNKPNSISINYHISQIIVNNTVTNYSFNIRKQNFNNYNILYNYNKAEFTSLKNKAIDNILKSIDYNNLFFYSLSDVYKLKQIKQNTYYKQEHLDFDLNKLSKMSKSIIEIPIKNNYKFQNNNFTSIILSDFKKEILFKANSITFEKKIDSLVINKLVLFMKLNNTHNLAITSFSKKNEYLHIDKEKRQEILNKYIEAGYTISKSQKLKLYRSMNIFQELVDKGIEPERINCYGLVGKKAKVKFNFFLK